VTPQGRRPIIEIRAGSACLNCAIICGVCVQLPSAHSTPLDDCFPQKGAVRDWPQRIFSTFEHFDLRDRLRRADNSNQCPFARRDEVGDCRERFRQGSRASSSSRSISAGADGWRSGKGLGVPRKQRRLAPQGRKGKKKKETFSGRPMPARKSRKSGDGQPIRPSIGWSVHCGNPRQGPLPIFDST